MTASSIRTADIGEEFIRAVVNGNPVTLKELAIRHGRSYAALRRAASDGKWSGKAVVARAERDATLAGKIAEKNAVTAVLIEEAVGREIDVRLRHAMLARSLQRVALQRLATMCPKDLSPTLAFHMLRAGIEEEITALGLANGGEDICDRPAKDDHQLRQAVGEAMAIMEKHSPSLSID